MDNQFHCDNEQRRAAVRNQDEITINGIDYLEVTPKNQFKLKVFFIHNLPGQTGGVPSAPILGPENFVIDGGSRVRNVKVEEEPYSCLGNTVTITVNERGDFSIYTLRLVTSATNSKPPKGFDPRLSTVEFSFKVNCPSEFDCKDEKICPPEKLSQPEINYLAKDYSSFRRLILDRLSVIMPDWHEDNAADLQMALVELLAYAGDHLSYFQDAVATEAYLGTARKRTSVRRHARLVDYLMHDGCNSRVWVCLEVEKAGTAEEQTLDAHTKLLTGRPEGNPVIAELRQEEAMNEQPVFETIHDLKLRNAHNMISFYTWSDTECCLPGGSTRATLVNEGDLKLTAGDVLVFEEVLSPTTGTEFDADPKKRHAVRLEKVIDKDDGGNPLEDPLNHTKIVEIEWYEQDALPFPVCISAVTDKKHGEKYVEDVSVAHGNVVLADHGLTIREQDSLDPQAVPDEGNYRPVLKRNDVTFVAKYDHEAAKKEAATCAVPYEHKGGTDEAATNRLRRWLSEALPSVWLYVGGETWSAKRDLLGSDRFAREFVVEMEEDLSAHLRFGDGTLGKKPSEGAEFKAEYRVGNGRAGNVGAEAIGLVETDLDGICRVRNPMPAVGGTNPETMDEVRQFAPQAFRIQERAVTAADYAEVTERHPEVQKAAARFRWTGSWYTVFVTVDRRGGHKVDSKFKKAIEAHLERYRIAGYDLEVNAPQFVPLEIVMTVCVKPNYFRGNVKETLLKVFSCHDLDNGQRGFFHPDGFTFGQPVYLSQLYEQAMDVAGVASVDIITFNRWGELPNKEIENGVLTTSALEIIRLDNDRNFQENGKIEFIMKGGL
jgi:hypothetical protein